MKNQNIIKNLPIRMPKFKVGDMVGWKSDTEFTKSNKARPAMMVLDFGKCIDGDGFEYRLSNNLGYVLQNCLELRTNIKYQKMTNTITVNINDPASLINPLNNQYA